MPVSQFERVVTAPGEQPAFAVGDTVKVGTRAPIGHYRVPRYLRGKTAKVVQIIEPVLVDNEEEGFGRNAGGRRHYFRISVAMTELWPPTPVDRLTSCGSRYSKPGWSASNERGTRARRPRP